MNDSPKRIPVYRQNQLSLASPCLLGEPCATCRAHAQCREGRPCRACRRGKKPDCERAYPAKPAFTVVFSQALALVRQGLAEFILRGTGLRLTFSKIAHLRDQSLRIDEHLLMAYAQGDRRARAIIDDPESGWCVKPAIAEIPVNVMQTMEERILYFG